MERVLAEAAADAGCLLMPAVEGLPFDAFRASLYRPEELFAGFDPADPASYQQCLDFRVYDSFKDPATHVERAVELEVTLLRRLHDASISEALDDFLDHETRLRAVAIMGGHNRGRDEAVYAQVAHLALELTQAGYLVLTGGGPGLMEAGNLGAYAAGFGAEAEAKLHQAIAAMKPAPSYKDKFWLARGYEAWRAMGVPPDPAKGRSVGIPTWFYGHEPPNVFATHIAKYFENSVREEGLLAFAVGGVIFAEGNAGTVQEIFQDACQNYYRTYAQKKSPMVLFGSEYWQKGKPAWPLLEVLAAEKGFADYLLLTDDTKAIVPFLQQRPPAA